MTDHTDGYPLFVIYSGESLLTIYEFLSRFGKGVCGIGDLCVIHNSSGQETQRTLALIDESIYADIVAKGFAHTPTFSITRYRLFYPQNPAAFRGSHNLYLPIPRNNSLLGSTVKSFLQTKLELLIHFGVIVKPPQIVGYRITVPLSSREYDIPKGHAYVSFHPSVQLDCIALTKIYLSNSYWPELTQGEPGELVSRHRVKVFWVKPKESAKGPAKRGGGKAAVNDKLNLNDIFPILNAYLFTIHEEPLTIPDEH